MKKNGITKEDENILKSNKTVIINGLFSCRTQLEVESSVGFARYLDKVGITRHNYPLFLKLLETNNKWVMDALLGKREPKLIFSTIKPNYYLIEKAFTILSFYHPLQIYPKVLQALLGIIEYSYYKADDGYRIYILTINDLNNLGKYLDDSKTQDNENNRFLLDVLDRITQLGEYEGGINKSVIAKHAFHIRIAFFDNTKKLHSIIPQVLLVKINRELYEISPSSKYISYLKNN